MPLRLRLRQSRYLLCLVVTAAFLIRGASADASPGAYAPAVDEATPRASNAVASNGEVKDCNASTVIAEPPVSSNEKARVAPEGGPEQTAESKFSAQSSIDNLQSSPDARADNAERPIKYWGNSFSLKFHRPSCAFAKAMNARHVVFFYFRRDAIASGLKPCRYCLPPFIKRVECKLLPRCQSVEATSAVTESQPSIAPK